MTIAHMQQAASHELRRIFHGGIFTAARALVKWEEEINGRSCLKTSARKCGAVAVNF